MHGGRKTNCKGIFVVSRILKITNKSLTKRFSCWSGSLDTQSVPTGGMKAPLRLSSGNPSASDLRLAFGKSLGSLPSPPLGTL